MPKIKTEIGLKAIAISFTEHCIVYEVALEKEVENVSSIVYCANDIKDKEIILKPTLITLESMEVIFTPVNVTVGFYQGLYKKILKNYSEYQSKLSNIYDIGEIVGYITYEP